MAWTPPSGTQPIVATASEGLELHWWIADDTDGAVAKALAMYGQSAAPSEVAARERMNANGLRIVRAPVAEFSALQRRLPAIQAWRRQWVGWSTAWTELFRGRRVGGGGAEGAALIVDGERRSVPAGALRLIARVWPAPINREDGALCVTRFEMTCQLRPEEPLTAADVFREPQLSLEEHVGPIFTQLTLDSALENGFIYVITSEKPGAVWRDGEAQVFSNAEERAEPGVTPGARPIATVDARAALAFEPLGPPVSRTLTLGEAMMTASMEETGTRDVKVVLVLLPRAPREFRLLP